MKAAAVVSLMVVLLLGVNLAKPAVGEEENVEERTKQASTGQRLSKQAKLFGEVLAAFEKLAADILESAGGRTKPNSLTSPEQRRLLNSIPDLPRQAELFDKVGAALAKLATDEQATAGERVIRGNGYRPLAELLNIERVKKLLTDVLNTQDMSDNSADQD